MSMSCCPSLPRSMSMSMSMSMSIPCLSERDRVTMPFLPSRGMPMHVPMSPFPCLTHAHVPAHAHALGHSHVHAAQPRSASRISALS